MFCESDEQRRDYLDKMLADAVKRARVAPAASLAERIGFRIAQEFEGSKIKIKYHGIMSLADVAEATVGMTKVDLMGNNVNCVDNRYINIIFKDASFINHWFVVLK